MKAGPAYVTTYVTNSLALMGSGFDELFVKFFIGLEFFYTLGCYLKLFLFPNFEHIVNIVSSCKGEGWITCFCQLLDIVFLEYCTASKMT